MQKVAIVVLSDPDQPEGRGRMIHALYAARELKDAQDEVKLIFDGIGVRWLEAFAKKDHPFTQNYESIFEAVKDKIAGACNFCAMGRFDIQETIEAENYPLLGKDGGHHGLRDLISEGYQIITY